MKKSAVKLMAVVATAVLLFSGCADGSPSDAAVVGGQRISLTEVESVSKAIAAKTPDSPDWGKWRADVLRVLVTSKLADQAKQQTGITITDAQRQQVYSANPLYPKLASDPATAGFIAGFADSYIVRTNAKGAAAFAAVVSTVPVEVNPAIGKWDPSQAQLTGASGSLSQSLS